MSFFRERQVKACRKRTGCYWCGQKIEIGEPKTQVTTVWEGDFGCTDFHPECNEARNQWMRENDEDGAWPYEGSSERGSTKEK